MITLTIIAAIVMIIGLGLLLHEYLREDNYFPEYYAPECFDCNKGAEECDTCKYKRW